MFYSRELGERYSPLYFLNAFVAGGIAISFFMYLFWMCRVLAQSLPSFGIILSMFDMGIVESLIAVVSLIGFVFFTVQHFLLLRWNSQSFKSWQKTIPYKSLSKSQDKTVLLTIHLTLCMSVMLVLILIGCTLPFIFDVAEYLFFAALVFLGVMATRVLLIYGEHLAATLCAEASPESGHSNNLGQMISLLCFAMFSLSFAVIAACSNIKLTLVVGYIFSVLFACAAVAVVVLRFLPRIRDLIERRVTPESSPLLWFAVCVLCLFGLAYYYQGYTLSAAFGASHSAGDAFANLTFVFIVSAGLGWMGRHIMSEHGFLPQLLGGNIYSAGLYAVLCPALSLVICGHYWINIGLVQTTMLEPWLFFYALFHLPIIAAQAAIVSLFFKLNAKLFPKQAVGKRPASLK